ncbi:MAG: porphobilinogen synthase [bacterium]
MTALLYRGRRMRRTETLRRMIRETRVTKNDLVMPMFVAEGKGVREEIPSMPGIYRFSVENAADEASRIEELGIPAVILFGIPGRKDEQGSEAWSEKGIIQRAVEAIKKKTERLAVITDVCLCEYTSHGHCGVLRDGEVDNDATLPLLAKAALSHVRAGADVVAPSDMMDGRVMVIRQALDDTGFGDVPIMAYSAKYASAFYGPFRDAAFSAPQSGDRRSYQMDPPNALEALREVNVDIGEGADIVMVKPALAYLDVISRVRASCIMPVAAYNVSGEYSLVKAAAARGWVDERGVVKEILTAVRRAGADVIITYHAAEAVEKGWLED